MGYRTLGVICARRVVVVNLAELLPTCCVLAGSLSLYVCARALISLSFSFVIISGLFRLKTPRLTSHVSRLTPRASRLSPLLLSPVSSSRAYAFVRQDHTFGALCTDKSTNINDWSSGCIREY